MMKKFEICGQKLLVKDYHCVPCTDEFQPRHGASYLQKSRNRLWLYVNVTDSCDASCPFCVAGVSAHSGRNSWISPEHFARCLALIRDQVSGVSFTGGEPMLRPRLLDQLLDITAGMVSEDIEIDLATNGTGLHLLPDLAHQDVIASIHVSRHRVDDEQNRRCMHWAAAPGIAKFQSALARFSDPGKVVLNCVLQKGGVENCSDVAEYLDFAIDAGVQNVSFISMFPANDFCRRSYVSPQDFPLLSEEQIRSWNVSHPESRFVIWNRHRDYDFCRCMSGSYENQSGQTRFYFRCPGTGVAPHYCRQLVYTAENQLRDGFGPDAHVLWESTGT